MKASARAILCNRQCCRADGCSLITEVIVSRGRSGNAPSVPVVDCVGHEIDFYDGPGAC